MRRTLSRQISQESRPNGKKVLERMAKKRRGRFLRFPKSSRWKKSMKAIAEEMRSQYNLAHA